MENLSKPIRKVFVKDATQLAEISLHQDSITKKKVLNIPSLGIQMPGDGASIVSGAISTPVASGTFSPNVEVALTCHEAGVIKAEELTLNTQTNCLVDCFYEPSFQLVKKVERPGYNNKENNFNNKRSYTGKLDTSSSTYFTSATGLITLAGNEALVNDLVTKVGNDRGLYAENSNPITNNSSAFVEARKAYHLVSSGWANDTIDLVITLLDGTVITGAQITTATNTSKAVAEAVNANATTKAYVGAYMTNASSATGEIVLFSLVNGATFTCTVSADVTKSVPSIILLSKSVDVQFECYIPENQFTKDRFSLAILDSYTTVASATTTVITNQGTTGASTDVTDDSQNAAAITAVCLSAYGASHVVATGGNGVTYVYAISEVKSMKFRFSSKSTGIVLTHYSSYPQWEILSYEKLRNALMHLKNSGMLWKWEDQDMPVNGTDYCVFHIVTKNNPEFSMHGASTYVLGSNSVDVYIPKSLVTSLSFAISGTKIVAGASISFLTVLGIWAGNDVAEFIVNDVPAPENATTLTIVFNDTNAAGGPGVLTVVINGITHTSVIADGSATTAVGAMKTVLDAAGYTTTNTDDPGVKNTFVIESPNTINSHSASIATSTGIAITSESLS